jgi:subtilisin family serine protease
MDRTEGRPEVVVGIVDGPIGPARAHGTFVAGILAARRGSPAPAICPACSFVARPLLGPTPAELARALIDCVDAGARVVNLSAATGAPTPNEDRELGEALDHALARGAVVVAAAGNQRRLGSSPITRHPAVLPVAACDRAGRPLASSNLGRSIGVRGLLAPGVEVTSLGMTRSGTSVAAPFVTGALALLCSLFPSARVFDVTRALTRALPRRASVVPPLLDARAAFDVLAATDPRR